MRWFLAVPLCLLGCSGGGAPELPLAVDVVGAWTADFLVNTSGDTSGKEVNSFGALTMETGAYEGSSDYYVGKATLISIVYAPQGSAEDRKEDADGQILAERVGTATYRGTWKSPAYEGSTQLDLSLNCEEIQLGQNRPDLMAVCGSPGFDASVGSSCIRPDGATTMQCEFGVGDIVFHRE